MTNDTLLPFDLPVEASSHPMLALLRESAGALGTSARSSSSTST
jgi:hypothetical protein